MIFFSIGNVVNKPEHGSLDWVKICEKSSKVITFIDLAGHERYLKTTVFGMTGHAPDFGKIFFLKLFILVKNINLDKIDLININIIITIQEC